jgi:hypothetical protein
VAPAVSGPGHRGQWGALVQRARSRCLPCRPGAQSARPVARHPSPPNRAGPAEFKAAFDFAYEAAGRAPAAGAPAAGAPGGVFGGLSRMLSFGGGGGSGSSSGNAKRRPLEADLRALKSLDSTLLKLGAVYSDAETRGA